MDIKLTIARLIEHHDLTADEMTSAMQAIMTGAATPAQVAGFLVALRMKGETVAEIAAAAQVMRSLASGVDLAGLAHTVDIVGTGGRRLGDLQCLDREHVRRRRRRVPCGQARQPLGFEQVRQRRRAGGGRGAAGPQPGRRSPVAWRRSGWASCSPRPTTVP